MNDITEYPGIEETSFPCSIDFYDRPASNYAGTTIYFSKEPYLNLDPCNVCNRYMSDSIKALSTPDGMNWNQNAQVYCDLLSSGLMTCACPGYQQEDIAALHKFCERASSLCSGFCLCRANITTYLKSDTFFVNAKQSLTGAEAQITQTAADKLKAMYPGIVDASGDTGIDTTVREAIHVTQSITTQQFTDAFQSTQISGVGYDIDIVANMINNTIMQAIINEPSVQGGLDTIVSQYIDQIVDHENRFNDVVTRYELGKILPFIVVAVVAVVLSIIMYAFQRRCAARHASKSD